MKKWNVVYYKSLSFCTYKTVYAKTAADAIKKARVKYIVDLILED